MKVAVVGAGISGMQSARLLEAMGCDVTVFEARDRIGGRLETVQEGEAIYEAGGEWIDADQPRLHGLVNALQGRLDEAVREPALAIYKGEVRRTDDLWQDLVEDETAVELSARALARELELPAWKNSKFAKYDSLDLASFLRQNCQSERGFWWMNANLRSDEGEDLERIGLLGWLSGYVHYIDRENLNRGESEMSAYRTPLGFSSLLESMRAALAGEVRLGRVLQRVAQSDGKVTLQFDDESSEEFDRVVLTLPPPCLEHVVFDPPLPSAKRCAVEACGMSRAIKIALQFKKTWWTERGFCGRFHCDGALQQMWDGTRGGSPVLTAYICGERAVEWTSLPDPISAAAYELGQYFPEAKDSFDGGWLHDWIHDPYSRGAFSHYRPGYVLEHSQNMIVPFDRVHFAGEHTATWVGFIEGALESAERVVAEVKTCEQGT
ncbi:MAG: FAD-dependent oxidoreductase [Armatimonadetes bacterium]|nr:FAD-dependent oxidoreductase [Armatimonadota bacterium]